MADVQRVSHLVRAGDRTAGEYFRIREAVIEDSDRQ